ncbi:MAG: glycosyltransferase family 4 protein [Actinomycetota bacterium]|nr:glycosyltransferase family 4 protein [Actinomycetota bacterium]
MIERGILYIVHSASYSVKQHILLLLKYLSKARYKPYLAMSDDEFLIEHVRKLGVDFTVVPDIVNANKFNVGGVAKKIVQFVEGHTINLVHSHDYQACFVGAQVAKLLNVPHISTIHTAEPIDQKKKGFFSIPNDKIVAMPNHLIAVSDVVKKRVEGLNNVDLIYNGIEAERFAETLDTEHLYRELGLTKGNNLIGVIARLTPGKGLDVFLKAASILLETKPGMHFVIVGEGPDLDNLKNMARSLGIADNVHFLGFRRDVAHILKSLDVVVIPNIEPDLPMVLLEAMACIRPVVVTDVAGVREVATEESVEFVPAGDAEAIAEAVINLLSDRDKAEAKAQAGQKLIVGMYNVNRMMKLTESLYLKIAG